MRQRRSARELGFVLVVATLFCAALLGSPSGVDTGGSAVSLRTGGARSITAFVFGAGMRPSFVRLQQSAKVLHADLSAGDLHVVALGLSPVTLFAAGGPNHRDWSFFATGLAVHVVGDDEGPRGVRTGLRLW